MAYLTLSEFKLYAGGKFGSEHDEMLGNVILPAAQKLVERYTRRVFEASADSVRYFDSRGSHIDGLALYFDRDLCAITQVINGDGSEVLASEYRLIGQDTPYIGIELLLSANAYWRAKSNGDYHNAISITGRWAYSVTAPEDIKYATYLIAKSLYDARVNPSLSERPIVTAQGDVVAPTIAMPSAAKRLLDAYKRL